jgi:hypothetical protein
VENNNVKQFFEELLYSLVKKILNFCNFSKKWNGNVARIIFRHCEYEGSTGSFPATLSVRSSRILRHPLYIFSSRFIYFIY